MAFKPSNTETPLPMKEMFVITCVLISEATCYMYLFPFVPFMVRDFGVVEEDVGFYSGWIAASFMWGQFFSSFLWGWASDKIGIRPVILFGLSVTVVGSTLFGLCTTLEQALFARLVTGLLNSNIGVAKTYLGLISDETNEARAFGFMSMSWGAGSILGPGIGGLLAQPVQNYPGLFAASSIWDQYPYLLPSVAAAFLPMCGLLVGIFHLQEPSREKRKATTPGSAGGGGGRGAVKAPKQLQHIRLEEEEDEGAGSKDAALHTLEEGKREAGQSRVQAGEVEMQGRDGFAEDGKDVERADTTASKPALRRQLSALEYARTSKVVLIVSAYGLFRFCAIAQDDATPLFMSTPTWSGGMGMDTRTIGLMLLGRGVTLVLMVLVVFPRLKRRHGALALAKASSLIVPIGILFFPFLKSVQESSSEAVLYVMIQLYFVILVFGFSIGFTSVMILVNNSAPARVIGTVNGCSQSAAALTSAVAPAVAGTLFSWSLTNGLEFPFDYHFVFFFIAACATGLGVILYFAPKSLGSRATDDEHE